MNRRLYFRKANLVISRQIVLYVGEGPVSFRRPGDLDDFLCERSWDDADMSIARFGLLRFDVYERVFVIDHLDLFEGNILGETGYSFASICLPVDYRLLFV